MGFAASQARLILLTARKSDLEFRAQQITNAEMMLAMRSEEIANKYSRKISNQTVKIIDGNREEKVTASMLAAMGYDVRCRSTHESWDQLKNNAAPRVYHLFNINNLSFDENGQYSYEGTDEQGNSAGTGTVSKGSIEDYVIHNGLTRIYEHDGVWSSRMKIAGVYVDLSAAYDGPFEEPVGDDLGLSLLQGLQSGNLYVVNMYDKEQREISVLDNSTGFVVCYDTSDDEAADAEYRRETAAIQVKEKRLQMEMKQIEAQQKACENEIESVKKLQDKNADSIFKYMS